MSNTWRARLIACVSVTIAIGGLILMGDGLVAGGYSWARMVLWGAVLVRVGGWLFDLAAEVAD